MRRIGVRPSGCFCFWPTFPALWGRNRCQHSPTSVPAFHLRSHLAAYVVADGVLGMGQTVIVDAVNAVEAARGQWRSLADRHGVPVVFIEVVCSDPVVHRRRLENRSRGIEGFAEPTWEVVERLREKFASCADHRLVLDTMTDLSSDVATSLGFLSATA